MSGAQGCAGGGTGQSAKSKAAAWPWTWGGVVTVLVPLCTLGLVLLGYGYTLAVQSVFGIDAALVADSLPEYLHLSTNVVVHVLSGVTEAVQQWQTYKRFYKELLPFLLLAGTAWALYFLIWRPQAWWAQKLNALSGSATKKADTDGQRDSPESNPVLTMPLAALRWCGRLIAWLWQKLAAAPRALWWAGASLAVVVGWPLIALALAMVAVVFIGYFLFGLLPFFGWMVGQSTLKQWVVEPLECVEVRSRDRRLVDDLPGPKGAAGAACICLQDKDGKEIARGRLVVSTSEAVILFDPLTGRVERIPVGDLTIRAVESLDKQAGSVAVVSKP